MGILKILNWWVEVCRVGPGCLFAAQVCILRFTFMLRLFGFLGFSTPDYSWLLELLLIYSWLLFENSETKQGTETLDFFTIAMVF